MWLIQCCYVTSTAACQILLGVPATSLHLQHLLNNLLLFNQESSDDPAAARSHCEQQLPGDILQQQWGSIAWHWASPNGISNLLRHISGTCAAVPC